MEIDRRLRIHVQGKPHVFSVVVPPGFEAEAIEELQELGIAASVQDTGLLEFSGRLEAMWLVHAAARIPNRIRMRLAQFRASHPAELRHGLQRIAWDLHLAPAIQLKVDVSCRRSRLMHTGLVTEIALDTIAIPAGPAVHGLQQEIHIRIEDDRCTVSLDASGDLLYLRGDSRDNGVAPLRDTVAAAILRKAGLAKCAMLVDPMAGSGTFTLEAVRWSDKRHPAHLRTFAFQNWPSFRKPAWEHLCRNLPKASEANPALTILCSDKDPRAMERVARNLEGAGLLGRVTANCTDFLQTAAPDLAGKQGLIVLNPPYGDRIGANVKGLFAAVGKHLRAAYKGWQFAIVVPEGPAVAALQLPKAEKIKYRHGGIPVLVLAGTIPA